MAGFELGSFSMAHIDKAFHSIEKSRLKLKKPFLPVEDFIEFFDEQNINFNRVQILCSMLQVFLQLDGTLSTTFS